MFWLSFPYGTKSVLRYQSIKGAQVQPWRFGGLNFDAYERLSMLYSLKHVESPLTISSTQTPFFHKV